MLGSKHLVKEEGDAIDFNIVNKLTRKKEDTELVGDVINALYPSGMGIIVHKHFIHFDTRRLRYRFKHT